MARSVIITTPRLTWDEIVKQYGLSEAEQKFVIRLVDQKVPRRSAGTARDDRPVSSKEVHAVARKTDAAARKKPNRARTAA